MLLAALPAVPDARLLVAGDGPMLDVLRAEAARRGLSGRVHFLGRVGREAMDTYMRAADYTVLYSGYEGLSHTLLESLRAGTPVIASQRGGNPEVVRHGENGLLVPHPNIEALAAALREALSPGVRARLAASTHIGMERFAFERMVAETDAALRAFV
jgi:glycosyltransferase involved in cell wall biosynthesis